MSEKGDGAKVGARNLLPVVSLAVAGLSLGSSAWQGYLNNQNIEIVQRDLSRRELVRSCRDIIEAYFALKLSVEKATVLGSSRSDDLASFEPRAAVYRFAALGTYLANFQGEAKRAEYTGLSQELQRVAQSIPGLKPDGIEAAFAKADTMFGALNADCVRSSHFETR